MTDYHLEPHEWRQYLCEIYAKHREAPGWGTLKSLHDEEDQHYLAMLDRINKHG